MTAYSTNEETTVIGPLGIKQKSEAITATQAAIVDSNNTNLSTLNPNTAWTGSWSDTIGYSQLITTFGSNQVGSFKFQFSADGVTVDRTVPASGAYYLAANVNSPQPLVPILRYYRAIYSNDSASTASLRIQSIFTTYAGVFQTRVADTPAPLSPATFTKAVPFGRTEGGGVYIHQSMTPEGHSEVSIQGPVTAFGQVSTADNTPIVQIQNFQLIGVNLRLLKTYTSGSSTVTTGSGTEATQLVASTGVSLNSVVYASSRRRIVYRAGQGLLCSVSARFLTPTGSAIQWVGLGDVSNGFAIGCSGTIPALRHWRFGQREIREFAVLTAANASETATVTLNGISRTVSLVNASSNRSITANAIAASDYSAVGGGWDAYAYSGSAASVVFVSRTAEPLTGTFSITSTGATSGTFSRVTPGSSSIETWIPQSSWNIDRLNGSSSFDAPNATNPSGMNLDITKLNTYKFQVQYHGSGKLDFSAENEINGQLTPVHRIAWGNENSTTNFGAAAFPVTIFASNDSIATDVKVASAAFYAAVEGSRKVSGPGGISKNSKSSITTETAIITILNPLVYNGRENISPLVMTEVVMTNQGGNGLVTWRAVRNPTLGSGVTATANFISSYNYAPTLVDTTYGGTVTDGEEIISTYQPSNTTSTRNFDVETTDIGRIYPGEEVTFLASTVGSAITAGVVVTWRWDILDGQ